MADGQNGQNGRFFTRDTDHLGFLEKQLKDLAGFATLTHELLQNADDARASYIAFHIDEDALRIVNDGRFTDCGCQEESDCPWIADGERGNRCDFHRLRRVASGDKRREVDTAGAFGVGFTAVYQVTDHPEIVSAGRHWILDEVQDASKRIRECDGCPTCREEDIPPTLFVLPWARQSDSPFRVRTRSTPVLAGDEARLRTEIQAALPTALLFLRHLTRAELWVNGARLYRIERLAEGDTVLVDDGEEVRVWHLLRGSFKEEADRIRARFSSAIEDKRRSEVTLAVPATRGIHGVLCAYLPTEHRTGLPFHLNADFIPKSDRKRIQFDGDAARAWNEAALAAAAETLADRLSVLQRDLAPATFWALLHDSHLARQAADRGEAESRFGVFWQRLEPVARAMASVYTGDQRWEVPRNAVHYAAFLEPLMLRDLERLRIPMVHPELQPYFNTLSALGVLPLSRGRYLAALQADLNDNQERDQSATDQAAAEGGPVADQAITSRRWWQSTDSLPRMWSTLAKLPEGSEKAQQDDREVLRALPAVVCRDGSLQALEECWVADEEVGGLLAQILPDVPIAAAGLPYEPQLRKYGDDLTVTNLITQLEHSAPELPGAYERDPTAFRALLKWLAGHQATITAASGLAAIVRRIPVIPSAGTVRPLEELSLPGDFTDELGIAGIVDLEAAGSIRDFLQSLGATPLTIAEYAREHVPQAFARPDTGADTRRAVVALLAGRLGELRDVPRVHSALISTRLVECEDDEWRTPSSTYFRTEAVEVSLGPSAAYARVPDNATTAVHEFLHWAGVREAPSARDVVEAITESARLAPSDESRRRIGQLFAALIAPFDDGELVDELVGRLKLMEWLPGRNDQTKWHRPDAVYTVFQDYLFATQAEFLDIPREVQQKGAKLLSYIGVRDTPDPVQVVRHLLTCAKAGADVNRQVYAVLARELADSGSAEVVRLLRGQRFIQVAAGRFATARQVVWGVHSFGQRRVTLDVSWRQYQVLLDAVGVRDAVDASDALDVLREIALEFGPTNQRLPEQERSVVRSAWTVISSALEAGQISTQEVAELRASKVVLSPAGHLVEPTALLFADRSDLAARFDALKQFFIVREAATWRGLLVAGVRPLWKAVHSRLLLSEDATSDPGLEEHLRARYGALLQVAMATAALDRVTESLEKLLRSLRCRVTSRVELRLELELGGRRFPHPPMEVLAAWDAEQSLLAWTGVETPRSWAAVAREMALALDPEGEWTGPLASGFKEALSARSLEEAHAALEALGYPRLTLELPDWNRSSTAAAQARSGADTTVEPPEISARTDLVGEEPSPQVGEAATRQERPTSLPGSRSGDPPGHSTEPSTAPERQQPLRNTDHQAEEHSLESENGIDEQVSDPLSRRAPAHDGTTERTSPMRTGASEGDHDEPDVVTASDFAARSRRSQRRFTATVYTEPMPQSSSADGEGEGRDVWGPRLETDAAGMLLVLEHERRAGRRPKEMPHAHPGYDVESCNPDGEVLRYIEVKSTTEIWGTRGVALSPIQLQAAKEMRERYWLYVVEQAGSEEARLLRLQDPYGHIEQFAFDATWRPFSDQGEEGA